MLTGQVGGLRPRPHTYYDMTHVTRADLCIICTTPLCGIPMPSGVLLASCAEPSATLPSVFFLYVARAQNRHLAAIRPVLAVRPQGGLWHQLTSVVTSCSHTFHKMARAPCKICSATQLANGMITNQKQAMSLGCEVVADHCAAAGPCVESAPGHTPWGALEHKGFMSWVQQTWSATASQRAAQAGPKKPAFVSKTAVQAASSALQV